MRFQNYRVQLFHIKALSTALSKTATENLIFEGKGLESVVNHYGKEIRELEEKKQILEEVESQTSSLFEHTYKTLNRLCKELKRLNKAHLIQKETLRLTRIKT